MPLAGHLAPQSAVAGAAAGWKAALGGDGPRAALGLRGPLVGRLVTELVVGSGASVSVEGWTSPRLEPEIAVRVGRDLSEPLAREELWDAFHARRLPRATTVVEASVQLGQWQIDGDRDADAGGLIFGVAKKMAAPA